MTSACAPPARWVWPRPITWSARANKLPSAPNKAAVQAGVDLLAQGGSAVDAAIGVQLVLNLVEPQSSGIGGGGFLLVHDADHDFQTHRHSRGSSDSAPLMRNEPEPQR